jgi:hypothetical protein
VVRLTAELGSTERALPGQNPGKCPILSLFPGLVRREAILAPRAFGSPIHPWDIACFAAHPELLSFSLSLYDQAVWDNPKTAIIPLAL